MKKLFLIFIFLISLSARADTSLNGTVDYIIDGDTFGATAILKNDVKISVRVRIMQIDAPERNGECESEIIRAQIATDKLSEILPIGSNIILSKIKDDKYLGRIDAFVKNENGIDVGDELIRLNLVRKYNGGKRFSWCE